MQPTDDHLERRRRLILLAEQIARAPLPARRPPIGLVAGLAAVGVVAMGAGVRMAVTDSSGEAAAGAATSVVPTAAPGAPVPPTTEAEVVSFAPVSPTSTPPGVEVPLPGQPVRWAVLADGMLHLRGQVPDLSTAQLLFSRSADRVGADSVVVEFSIVPGAAQPVDDPVHAPEIARFQPGSTALLTASVDAIRAMVQSLPDRNAVTIAVHPDALATDDALDASRADALRQLLIGLGIDPARVTVEQPAAYGPAVVDDVADALSITVRGWFG
jgi:outer membrane protein OmpA-like peptidoglycan-associated protein